MSQFDPLFKKFVEGYTFGELPKVTIHGTTTGRIQCELPKVAAAPRSGMVTLEDGTKVHHSKAVYLPKNGRMVWVEL